MLSAKCPPFYSGLKQVKGMSSHEQNELPDSHTIFVTKNNSWWCKRKWYACEKIAWHNYALGYECFLLKWLSYLYNGTPYKDSLDIETGAR